MLRLPSTTVTVDISSSAIRLLMVRKGRVVKWASAPLDPGSVAGGVVLEPASVASRLRRLMKATGMMSRRVVAGISGLHSTYHLLPSTSMLLEGPPREMIMHAAGEVMPLPVEELYLTWQAIGSNSNGGGAGALVLIGMPRGTVDGEVMALRSAGTGPPILNLKVLALRRLVPVGNALIANLESDCLDIGLVVDGIPRIVRSIGQPSHTVVRDYVACLAHRLQETLVFYQARDPDTGAEPAFPLFLAGEMVTTDGMVQMVRDAVPYSVEPLRVAVDCPPDLPVMQFAVNLGLALVKVAPPGRAASFHWPWNRVQRNAETKAIA